MRFGEDDDKNDAINLTQRLPSILAVLFPHIKLHFDVRCENPSCIFKAHFIFREVDQFFPFIPLKLHGTSVYTACQYILGRICSVPPKIELSGGNPACDAD